MRWSYPPITLASHTGASNAGRGAMWLLTYRLPTAYLLPPASATDVCCRRCFKSGSLCLAATRYFWIWSACPWQCSGDQCWRTTLPRTS
eukprot:3346519-Lingulodinium_polyedra.AAC.1